MRQLELVPDHFVNNILLYWSFCQVVILPSGSLCQPLSLQSHRLSQIDFQEVIKGCISDSSKQQQQQIPLETSVTIRREIVKVEPIIKYKPNR